MKFSFSFLFVLAHFHADGLTVAPQPAISHQPHLYDRVRYRGSTTSFSFGCSARRSTTTKLQAAGAMPVGDACAAAGNLNVKYGPGE